MFAVGPDGNIWFTQRDAIGVITADGKNVTRIQLPNGMHAIDIVAGPDGNIWFTDLIGGAIGRLDVATIGNRFSVVSRGAVSECEPGRDDRVINGHARP